MNEAAKVYREEGYSNADSLFEKHVSLVKIIAHHIGVRLPPGKCIDDLIQVGMIGLLEASRTYLPNLGAEFKSYASIRIRGAILDELRRETWMPRSIQHRSRQLSNAIQSTEAKLGRSATDREIAEEMGVSLEDYGSALESIASCTVFSLDDGNNFNEPESNEDVPFENVQNASTKAMLAQVIGTLPEQEKLVVALYYDYGLNLREIGEVLDVSESRVCQIHSQATSRLRSRMRNLDRNDEL
jgi:RNA polymerase sigma factor for flagellar operon FliA